jgi:hypothetical protein
MVSGGRRYTFNVSRTYDADAIGLPAAGRPMQHRAPQHTTALTEQKTRVLKPPSQMPPTWQPLRTSDCRAQIPPFKNLGSRVCDSRLGSKPHVSA